MPQKLKPGQEVAVAKLPPCDRHPDREAHYDFATILGPWMNGCDECFHDLSVGRITGRRLGVGLGQRLVVRKSGDAAS